MQWRDTATRFGSMTRALHWVMAVLLAWQLTGMALKLMLGRHPVVATFVGVHQQVGLVLLLLAGVRLIWALANRSNRPKHAPNLLGRLAVFGQRALYLLLLVVPVLGILRANTRGLRPAPGASASAPAEVDSWLAGIAALHGPLAWTLLALILGHIMMAILHAAVWRDGASATMLGRLRD